MSGALIPSEPRDPEQAGREGLRARRGVLERRAGILRDVRDWFTREGFLEVETPVRVAVPALEEYIDAIAAGDQFLRTSPELHMKRLLAAGYDKIYQLGPCFRRDEEGPLHRPEYTLLEWYRPGDYLDILADIKSMLWALAGRQAGGGAEGWGPEWTCLTVSEAFRAHAGWDPVERFDADRFDRDTVERIEPALARFDTPVVLLDWPIERGALARRKPGQPRVAERWELYVRGIELANAFSELTDAREQRARFLHCARARARAGREVYALDESFLAALEAGIPDCGGAALGFDRLVMLLTGATAIDEVRAF